ncbi:transglycosylase domain-containing protein [Bacillus solimangrovi]|uniref:Peptidoglycan glycosyltransferase n=1 Tax=Bacillus solimangrovi TaxID=1305675 RepID=A0A1E5LCI6_9BACI|nr:transglycosylase domain-containing protein [Bacillus solimangrovi]OEH91802.1 peptidoglycan glycosyltransferase [Bacillus solimangrovi]
MEFKKNKVQKTARITYKVFWNLTLIFAVLILTTASFAGGVGAGYFASLVKDEPIRSEDDMKKDIYNYEETTELYFANNVYLGKLRSDLEREEVAISDVSDYLKQAIIATEDEYFNEHNGVVPKAILRALYQEFTNAAVQTGGSTLTQQLIKNQILTNEVSFERKAKEILLALRLERFFEKEEILEAYLNVVPFGRNSSGRNIAGIQTASQGVFGVDAKDLNLAQAAYLAGLPQSPSGYTPFTNRGEVKDSIEPSLNRMQKVLDRMLSVGDITKAQYEEALNYDILANLVEPKSNPIQEYPWLTYEIERRAQKLLTLHLAAQDGYTEKDLEKSDVLYQEYYLKSDKSLRQDGYRIYSTIDKEIYDKMQEIKNNYAFYGYDKPEMGIDPETGEKERILEPVEVGGMLIENQTGKIVSFIGGRDHEIEQLNHATLAKRSNGSTMKPLLVYAPAMELGMIQPGSILPDIPVAIPTGSGTWKPENYGGAVHGFTSARNALARSYNIPVARIYADLINQNPTDFLKQMGFTSLTKNDPYHLSLALGGLEQGVTIEENTNAYATFANNGKFVDAYMIDKIETGDGEVVYEHEVTKTDVFSPQTTYLTIDMLRDVISSGTAAGLPARMKFNADWAGKTGTSQDYKDAWFVATNPNVTFGLWMGYDTPKPLDRYYKGFSYSQRNLKLWAELMNATYDIDPELVAPSHSFERPEGIVSRSYCAISGMLPSDLCEQAGLVRSDIFNTQFGRSQVDDTLEIGKYVTINDKHYRVPENAPSEFVNEGIMLKESYIEEEGFTKLSSINSLIPNSSDWSKLIIPEKEILTDDGNVPSVVTGLNVNDNQLSWSKLENKDILGYRIYRADNSLSEYKLIGQTNDIGYLTTQNSGNYYVTAVDITNNESLPSNTVSIGTANSDSDSITLPTETNTPIIIDDDLDIIAPPTETEEID